MDLDGLTAFESRCLSERAERSLKRELWAARTQAARRAALRGVFRQYATLAAAGEAEALKRALFMAWAKYSEPFLPTGLEELDETNIRELLAVADGWARAGRLDAELTWMLPYYFLVDDRYLEGFAGFEELKRVSRLDPLRYRTECLSICFENRGLLGEYWRAKQRYLRSRQTARASLAGKARTRKSTPIAAA